jgi:uncharacterized membrane protein
LAAGRGVVPHDDRVIVGQKPIFSGLLFLLFGLNVLLPLGGSWRLIADVLIACILSLLPGIVILLCLRVRELDAWEYITYSVGASLGYLIFLGLGLNTILPQVGIFPPLALPSLVWGLNVSLVLLLFAAYTRNHDLSIKIEPLHLNRITWIFMMVAALFPLGATWGAIQLNIGAGNYLSMVTLGVIGVFVFALVLLHQRVHPSVFPWAIYTIGLALLLIYSMRSSYVMGWDVNLEYDLFQRTVTDQYWSISPLRDQYESCLSITILPAIFAEFLSLDDVLIFKLLFQMYFAFVPLAVYLLFRDLIGPIASFLAGFLIVSQIWYTQVMPALVRQEIAFLFLLLILLTVVKSSLHSRTRQYLLYFCMIALVVSHYSTSYIWAAVLIIYHMLYFTMRHHIITFSRPNPVLSVANTAATIAVIFLWNAHIAQTSSTTQNFMQNIQANLVREFSVESILSGLDNLLLRGSTPNTQERLDEYLIQVTTYYRNEYPDLEWFDPATYQHFELQPIQARIIYGQAEELGPIITRASQIARFVLIVPLPVLGIGVLFWFFLRKSLSRPDLFLLAAAALPLLVLVAFLPIIKLNYNLFRLHIQLLVLLAYPTMVAALFVFGRLKQVGMGFLGLIFVAAYLFMSGFTIQYTGGTAVEHLNNFGEGYAKYYTFPEEVAAAEWLVENSDSEAFIYADQPASLRLIAHTRIDAQRILNDVFPSTLDRNAYVYMSATNTLEGRVLLLYGDAMISFAFPRQFLDENKDLVYSNGTSLVFR